jgi:hypothetical protein
MTTTKTPKMLNCYVVLSRADLIQMLQEIPANTPTKDMNCGIFRASVELLDGDTEWQVNSAELINNCRPTMLPETQEAR